MNEDAVQDNSLSLKFKRMGDMVEVGVLAARSNTQIGSVQLFRDDADRLMRIETSYLEPAYQHRGIGRALYSRIDSWARENYGYRLASDIKLSEPAKKLWQGLQSQGMATLQKGKNGGEFYAMRESVWPYVSYTALKGPWGILAEIFWPSKGRGH